MQKTLDESYYYVKRFSNGYLLKNYDFIIIIILYKDEGSKNYTRISYSYIINVFFLLVNLITKLKKKYLHDVLIKIIKLSMQ
jgi:hypothetical protein